MLYMCCTHAAHVFHACYTPKEYTRLDRRLDKRKGSNGGRNGKKKKDYKTVKKLFKEKNYFNVVRQQTLSTGDTIVNNLALQAT